DFNADSGYSTPWRTLRDAGYDDARESAARIHGDDIGTFPDYGPVTGEGPRIDWIMTCDFEVDAYAAHAPRLDGAWTGDRACVMAELTPSGAPGPGRCAGSVAQAPGLGQQLQGLQAVRRIVVVGGQDQLVGARGGGDLLELAHHRGGGADRL